MINGAHVIVYSRDADADRAFFRDTLGFPHVAAGHGWLIFQLPPAEIAMHPTDEGQSHEVYLMCDDIESTVEELAARSVEFTTPVTDRGWGLMTSLRLPGGSRLGLYEPRHPTAHPAGSGK